MYTFKQAVKDCKEYLNTDMAQTLLRSVNASITNPSYKEIIEAVDSSYKVFYTKLLFKGKLKALYAERERLEDRIFISDWHAQRIIKNLVLFGFCGDFNNPKLKTLRELISELINLYQVYIEADRITQKEYNDLINLGID